MDINNEDDVRYSFEINESFGDYAQKLAKSMKDGLVSHLGKNEYDNIVYNADGRNTSVSFVRHNGEAVHNIKIENARIVLSDMLSYNDSPERSLQVIIEPNKNGGCTVSGDVADLLLVSGERRNVFVGARNLMTYKPDTFYMLGFDDEKVANVDDTFLLEQDKRKLTLQAYKNEIAQVSFDSPLIGRVLEKAKQRVKSRLKVNNEITDGIKSGVEKTGESGYGYISEADRRGEQKSPLDSKNMKDAKDSLAK